MAGKKPQDFTPHELFRRIDAQAISRDYRHKQAIFALGDKADAMFYVQNGNVKLTVASKNGKKAVIAILRQGDFLGEGCLVRQSMRVSSATAIQPSTIARVKKVSIVRLIHEDPAFVKLFISHLLSRFAGLLYSPRLCQAEQRRRAPNGSFPPAEDDRRRYPRRADQNPLQDSHGPA